jgi:hypothetical protein
MNDDPVSLTELCQIFQFRQFEGKLGRRKTKDPTLLRRVSLP